MRIRPLMTPVSCALLLLSACGGSADVASGADDSTSTESDLTIDFAYDCAGYGASAGQPFKLHLKTTKATIVMGSVTAKGSFDSAYAPPTGSTDKRYAHFTGWSGAPATPTLLVSNSLRSGGRALHTGGTGGFATIRYGSGSSATEGTFLCRVPGSAAYPPFAGSSASKTVTFTDDDTHLVMLVAKQYAVSSDLQTALTGSSIQTSASIYRANPTALAAALSDPRHIGLSYGLLYNLPQANMYDASWTPTTASDAANRLDAAWGLASNDPINPVIAQALGSMFQDTAFRATDVSVFLIHWDNGDDTNADGILAIKSTTGEMRLFVLMNPA